jgi:WD40 repeat protein
MPRNSPGVVESVMRVVAEGKWFGAPGFAHRHEALITLRWDGIRFWKRNLEAKKPAVTLRQRLHIYEPIELTPDDRYGIFGGHLLDLAEVWEAFEARGTTRLEPRPVELPLSGDVRQVQFSPDGRRLFIGRWTGLWDIVDFPFHPESNRRLVSGGVLAVGPDGRTVALSGGTNAGLPCVKLVDLETREELATFVHSNHPQQIVFSPDGRRLGTATMTPSKVRIWDVAGRECAAEFKAFRGAVAGLAFHPSGRFLIAAGRSGEIRCYDTLTNREAGRFQWEIGELRGLALSPDGLTAAVVGSDRGVLIWDLDDLLPH